MGREKFSYDPALILTAWISASLGSSIIIFILLFPLAGVRPEGSSRPVIEASGFLFEAAWCLSSYFLAAVVAWTLGGTLRRLVPAWLIVSLIGTVVFTSTLWGYSYVHSPDPKQAPSFESMILSAAGWSISFFLMSGFFSLGASLMSREKATGFYD